MAVNENTHWRDSAYTARFFFVDARAAFPLVCFLLHIRWWTFILALLVMLFFAVIEKYGFSLVVFGRALRGFLSGPRKSAIAWWNQ